MRPMTISQLARTGNVGVETIRYYQRRGLLPEPARSTAGIGGGVRRYGADDARRLHFIRTAQVAGFSLAEIGELLRLDASRDRERVRDMAQTRLALLDRQLADLRNARRWLAELEHQCAIGVQGPCPILQAFIGSVPAVATTGPG